LNKNAVLQPVPLLYKEQQFDTVVAVSAT